MSNDIEFGAQWIEFLDLLEYTTSNKFVEKYRYLFRERLLKQFQLKFIEVLQSKRPITVETLTNHLVKKCKNPADSVKDLFEAIDIEIYNPIIKS